MTILTKSNVEQLDVELEMNLRVHLIKPRAFPYLKFYFEIIIGRIQIRLFSDHVPL